MIPDSQPFFIKGIEYLITGKTQGGMGEILFLERKTSFDPVGSFVFSFPRSLVAKSCKNADESGFIRECNFWLELERLKGIAPLLHVVRLDGKAYAVMPRFEGNFAQLLASGKFDRPTLIRALIPCFNSLYHIASSRNIVHRDIKPENILYSLDEGELELFVSDWGIAQLNSPTGDLRDRIAKNGNLDMFRTGKTEHYCSPERFIDPLRTPDTREDIFSFGVILMELFCNQRPYKWVSVKHEIIHGAYFFEAQSILKSSEIELRLATLILSMLDPDITKRPKNFRKIARKLNQLF